MCFKCGSTEHDIYKCKLKIKGEPLTPFSFNLILQDSPTRSASSANGKDICRVTATKTITASSRRVSNTKNRTHFVLFPGGSCHTCGSKSHTVANCPTMTADVEQETIVYGDTIAATTTNVEDESTRKTIKGKKVKALKVIRMK